MPKYVLTSEYKREKPLFPFNKMKIDTLKIPNYDIFHYVIKIFEIMLSHRMLIPLTPKYTIPHQPKCKRTFLIVKLP